MSITGMKITGSYQHRGGDAWELVAELPKDPIQKQAGLPHCRFHDLRHLCASVMVRKNVHIKVAQQILGHKDIKTTGNIYAHVMPSGMKEASDTIGDFLYNDLAN